MSGMLESGRTSKNDEKRIETQAKNIVEPILRDAGYVLWDVIFEKEGAMWYLRVLFDKEDSNGQGGITDEECEAVTVPINAAFDRQKFTQNVDILEIGSPGLTRRLRLPEHFEACKNMAVRATVRGDNGKTEVIYGRLESFDEQSNVIYIRADGEKISEPPLRIELKKCIRVNLDF